MIDPPQTTKSTKPTTRTDRCLEGDEDERWERDLAWAREALAPFRDIPLTPEQQRGLVLWLTPGPT